MTARGGRSYQPSGREPGQPTSSASSIDLWFARMAKSKPFQRVLLTFESLSGVEEVEVWTRAELDAGAGETIFASAQSHCEDLGAVGRYTIRLVADVENGASAFLGSKSIRVTPTDAAGELPIGATSVEDPSMHGVVAQVLRHNEALIRMYVGSMGGVLGRMHDLLKMEQAENDLLRRRIRTATKEDGSTEDEESAAAKAEAFSKLTEALTVHVIPALARRYGGTDA